MLLHSGAAPDLRRLGHAADVEYRAQINVSDVVPRLVRPGEASRYPLTIVGAGRI